MAVSPSVELDIRPLSDEGRRDWGQPHFLKTKICFVHGCGPSVITCMP